MMKKTKSIQLMQVLKYIENRFDNLSIKAKYELYIFPLILIFAFMYFFTEKKTNKVEILHNNTLNEKKMDKSILNIVKDLENSAKELNVEIVNTSINKKQIEFEVIASHNKQILFIKSLEYYNSFSKIKELDMRFNSLFVVIDFNKFYVKKQVSKAAYTLEEDLKLQAVVNKKAFINNVWLKKGENIGSFKILTISKRKVILDNGLKKIELRLNEYL